MDLTSFAEQVGTTDPVTITGLATRGGPVPDVRVVGAPVGIDWIQAAEMTASVGAGTPVDLAAQAALRDAFDPRGLANPGKVLPSPAGCGDLQVAKAVAEGAWI